MSFFKIFIGVYKMTILVFIYKIIKDHYFFKFFESLFCCILFNDIFDICYYY